MKIVRTYKYRMYPSANQTRTLELWGKWCRQLYNLAIEQRRLLYAQNRKYTSWQTQSKELPLLKESFVKYSQVPAGVFEFMLKQLDQAYKKYFDNIKSYRLERRKKFPKPPRFKSYRDRVTLTHMRPNGFRLSSTEGKFARIYGFPKLSDGLTVRYHRPIDGKVLGQKITSHNGKWYLCVIVEKDAVSMENNSAVGIDIGIARNVQLSTSESDYKNLPLSRLKELLAKKKKLQKQLRRKQGGNRKSGIRQSNNYRKAYARVAKIDEKMANIRQYHHKMFAAEIVKEHGIIFVEDLDLSGMTGSAKGTIDNPGKNVKQKSGLNRSLLNVSPYFFRQALENKAAEFGAIVTAVPAPYTSQTCSRCGHCSRENRRSQADFNCTQCGLEINADYNASLNILKAGIGFGDTCRVKVDSREIL